MNYVSPFAPNASPHRANDMSRLRVMLVCAALLLTSELGIAENLTKSANESPAFRDLRVHVHGSKGKPDGGAGDAQAIAREMADAMDGNIEQPVMAPTRSTFLAKWQTAPGATGYRLDVSISPSFDSYVGNYRDLDIGNVTSQIVSGLDRGTQYYYRVRPYNSSGIGANSETARAATASTTSGLVIVPTFDSTITNDPRSSAIQTMIISTIQAYQALFNDPITVSIRFRLSAFHLEGDPMGNLVGSSNSCSLPVDWDAVVTALKADGKTANDAAAYSTLPTSPLTSKIVIRTANGRAIGLDTPTGMFADASVGVGGPYDGIITLNPAHPLQFTRPVSADNFDARTFLEHEIDEVLGLGSHLNSPAPQFLDPLDLFSWASLNARNTTTSGVRHFSIDRGLHFIVQFNQDPEGDFGDFDSDGFCPANRLYVQNAFNCPGQSPEVSATSPEGIILDTIGYDLNTDAGNSGVLGNISTRLPVGTGENVLIAGFQITGSGTKQVVVRALGPTLTQFGLSNAMEDTVLELHNASGAEIATNDDWQDDPNSQSIPSVLRPSNEFESAILANLSPGAYTAVLRGYEGGTGLALVEVYDVSAGTTQLANISSRGLVQAGNDVMIAGIVVQRHDKRVVIRALGPSLTAFGITNALPDPTLDLFNGNGALITSNDDWQATQPTTIAGTGLAPSSDLESAIAINLAPGSYTAVVRGFDGAAGNALVEVYGVN